VVTPGKLSHLDQLITAVSSVIADGRAAGMRAIDARVAHGIDLRILPDRGLDLGAAWFRGVPLAWISPNGETPAPSAEELTGTQWRDAWPGGLMTTCGLSNVGQPSDGFGLHGTYTARRAEALRCERTHESVTITATINDPPFRLQRRIATSVGRGVVRVDDQVTNLAGEAAAAPMLYHVNIGAPMWDTDARVESDASEIVPLEDYGKRTAAWKTPSEPREDSGGRVYEHVGARWARLTNPNLGVVLTVRSSLPRFWQWVDVSPSVYALGLEPANCSVRGRSADIAADEMPFLGPGETRDSWLMIEAEILQ
jgi:hypothetical protein